MFTASLFVLDPNEPSNLLISQKLVTEINIRWSQPEGKYDSFWLVVYKDNSLVKNYTIDREKTEHRVSGLEAGTEYLLKLYGQITVDGSARQSATAAEQSVTTRESSHL